MPLANGGGGITCIFKHISHGVLLGANNHLGVAICYASVLSTPGILTREQSIARGSTGGGCRMRIGKLDTLLAQLVHIGRLHILGTIATEVPISQVVRHNDDDVGLFLALIIIRLSMSIGGVYGG